MSAKPPKSPKKPPAANGEKVEDGKWTVFYDGECDICTAHHNFVEGRERFSSRMNFLDSREHADLAARHGFSANDTDAVMCAIAPDGRRLAGMDALTEMYRDTRMGWLLRLTRRPVLRPATDWLYLVLLARHRLKVGRAVFGTKRRLGL